MAIDGFSATQRILILGSVGFAGMPEWACRQDGQRKYRLVVEDIRALLINRVDRFTTAAPGWIATQVAMMVGGSSAVWIGEVEAPLVNMQQEGAFFVLVVNP